MIIQNVLFKRYYDDNRGRSYGHSDDNKQQEGKKVTVDPKLWFCIDLLDNIHQWLFHLFETGMRS